MTTILTLTDSRTHGSLDSVYELLKALSRQDGVTAVWVADRGCKHNNKVFETADAEIVFAKLVDSSFKFDEQRTWFRDWQEIKISDFDVTLIRLDRPVSDNNLCNFSKLFAHTRIVNNPDGIIETGSKEFLLRFPDLCPPMSICQNFADVKEFALQYEAVFKPLHGYGGAGIVRITKDVMSIGDEIMSSDRIQEAMQIGFNAGEQYLGMKYLKNISQGDKRVIVVGSSVLGATLRLPAGDSFLCNLSSGGSAHPAEPDTRELEIASRIIPELNARGVYLFGFDTLVDDDGLRILSEINTLNVGGLIQAQEFSGKPVIELAAQEIVNSLNS